MKLQGAVENNKKFNIHIMQYLEKYEAKKIFEEVMAKNFPNLAKDNQ